MIGNFIKSLRNRHSIEETGHKNELSSSIESNFPIQVEKELESEKNSKLKEKFNSFKNIYRDKFDQCNSPIEVIETYKRETEQDKLMEEVRLRYVAMYLFNRGLSKDKLSTEDIKKLILCSSKDNNELAYSIIIEFIDNEIKQSIGQVNLDNIFLKSYIKFQDNSDTLIKNYPNILTELNRSINDRNRFSKDMILKFYTKYWDSENKEIHFSTVYMFYKNIIIIYDNGRLEVSSVTDDLMDYSKNLLDNGAEYMISLLDTYLVIDKDTDEILEMYCDKVNKKIMQKYMAIKEELDSIIDLASDDIKNIAFNYLDMIPNNFMLDRDYYIMFEMVTASNDKVAQLSLTSNQEERELIISKLEEDSSIYEEINNFVETNFDKFATVISKYFQGLIQHYYYIAWKLVCGEAIKYYSQQWLNEYGAYINDDNNLSFDDYLNFYCRCRDISTKNVETVGKFTYYLMSKEVFSANSNFLVCNQLVIDKIFVIDEVIELELFENKLLRSNPKVVKYSINDVDVMNGHEFESFVGILFTKMGYDTEVTKGSGDQGLDIIAVKNGVKIGIQVKCYSNKVTNKAVQEITAALNLYNCDKGMVVTNNYFTESAIELAESNNVILWDRDILKRKIEEIF